MQNRRSHGDPLPSTAKYSQSEIAKHNHRQSAWVAIEGTIYDVTCYLNQHPGGSAVLMGVLGTDATKPFRDTGHTCDAISEMKQLPVVGQVAQDESEWNPPHTAAGVVMTLLQAWGLPLLLAVVAIALVLVSLANRKA